MYNNLIFVGSSKRIDDFPYSFAECIQVENIKDLLPVYTEKLIKKFVKNNWNELNDNNELIDNWWAAENIDTVRMKFDITQNGNKKWEGYVYSENWATIKRI